jgi:hypothetical protein
MDTPINALLRITLYYQYWPVYPLYDFFDATENNLSFSHFRYIWTLLLLLNTILHEWSRLVTLCNELLCIICFDLYTVSKTFWCNLT